MFRLSFCKVFMFHRFLVLFESGRKFAFRFPDIALVAIFAWDGINGATSLIFSYWIFRFMKTNSRWFSVVFEQLWYYNCSKLAWSAALMYFFHFPLMKAEVSAETLGLLETLYIILYNFNQSNVLFLNMYAPPGYRTIFKITQLFHSRYTPHCLSIYHHISNVRSWNNC